MKVIAMYLPQFHKVRENDEWWGEGFTEWTAVKGAYPLYEGHNQPRVPLNDNYYDLLQKETMMWQANLMKQYGIDGICMYHYWFKDGRQILEKPAENLLAWKDLDLPFCFCWANETWARSWSKLENTNAWADRYEKKVQIGERILLEQRYGGKKEWKEHFNYLLPFFCDERYIRIDDKPLFYFYKAEIIPCFENMVDYWQSLARESGLEGIYVVVNKCRESSRCYYDKEVLHEPANILRQNGISTYRVKEQIQNVLDYDLIWSSILENPIMDTKIIQGGFVSYDDTPRRGKKGISTLGATADKFKIYMAELLAKNKTLGNEFVFLNAWNEWGEGMYLEPDEADRESYLEAVLYAKKNFEKYIEKYKIISQKKQSDNRIPAEYKRCKHYNDILDKWLFLMENKVSLEEHLYNLGYTRIALYGFGVLGKHFERSISGKLVSLEYIIDRNKDKLMTDLPVFLPEEVLPEVELIVVSATFSYGEVYKLLRGKGIEHIISLEELILENI